MGEEDGRQVTEPDGPKISSIQATLYSFIEFRKGQTIYYSSCTFSQNSFCIHTYGKGRDPEEWVQ